MTDDDLAEIEARANAAQPPPWPLPGGRDSNYDARLPLDHEGCDVWPWGTEENMIFAYKAREDVPRLVAEVRRLRRAIAEAMGQERGEMSEQ
jgi:hypothetical protein